MGRCSRRVDGVCVAAGVGFSGDALADDSAARIVKRYARRVGLDPASYAGHSLRSGFLTSAAESGASIWKLSGITSQEPRHAAWLCSAGRPVQGTRGGGVPVICRMHAVHTGVTP